MAQLTKFITNIIINYQIIFLIIVVIVIIILLHNKSRF